MIIYLATNKLNGKMYIGQTIHTLKKRKQEEQDVINESLKNAS